jgi:hypothetical protein
MKLDEIPVCGRSCYTEICPCCSLEQEILTQRDNFPEYYTEIYLKCQCGQYIEFELPVN